MTRPTLDSGGGGSNVPQGRIMALSADTRARMGADLPNWRETGRPPMCVLFVRDQGGSLPITYKTEQLLLVFSLNPQTMRRERAARVSVQQGRNGYVVTEGGAAEPRFTIAGNFGWVTKVVDVPTGAFGEQLAPALRKKLPKSQSYDGAQGWDRLNDLLEAYLEVNQSRAEQGTPLAELVWSDPLHKVRWVVTPEALPGTSRSVATQGVFPYQLTLIGVRDDSSKGRSRARPAARPPALRTLEAPADPRRELPKATVTVAKPTSGPGSASVPTTGLPVHGPPAAPRGGPPQRHAPDPATLGLNESRLIHPPAGASALAAEQERQRAEAAKASTTTLEPGPWRVTRDSEDTPKYDFRFSPHAQERLRKVVLTESSSLPLVDVLGGALRLPLGEFVRRYGEGRVNEYWKGIAKLTADMPFHKDLYGIREALDRTTPAFKAASARFEADLVAVKRLAGNRWNKGEWPWGGERK